MIPSILYVYLPNTKIHIQKLIDTSTYTGIKDMRLPAVSFEPSDSAENIFNSAHLESASTTISGADNNHKDDIDDDQEELKDEEEEEDMESIIRGAHAESRLFFEPATAQIIPAPTQPPFKECVVSTMETEDPYSDFRASMEEMVETHGLVSKEWGSLEELLAWYLRVNRKTNHPYIVAAFVDLLLKLSSPESPGGCSSSSSRRSSSFVSGELQHQTTSCFSSSPSSPASVSLSPAPTICFNSSSGNQN